MQRRKRLLRVTAALMLIGTGIGRFEPLVGLSRDGAVHHEGPVAATQHATVHSDGLEHRHDSESAPREHGSEQRPGTGADHCTHVHGPAVIGESPTLLLRAVQEHAVQTELPHGSDPHPTKLLRPPRA